MGRVLLVRDLHLQRELALKLLLDPPLDRAELEQVQREFRLLAGIEHPGIARAHDFGYLGGRPYFTSEFIAGEPLSRRKVLADGAEVLDLARSLARPLAFLHRGDVLHLDLKPSNIMVPEDRTRARAVLIDFGVFRRSLAAPAEARLRGSLPFLAPEYFLRGKLGPWTDIYAVGVTLYHAATGCYPRLPAEGPPLTDGAAWLAAPPPPSRIRASLPPEVDHLVLRCLALDPGSRFNSAVELLEALPRTGGVGGEDQQPAGACETLGRAAEFALLDRFLDRLAAGEEVPPAILLTGLPGMGQTHLLREMKVRAQTRGFPFYLECGFPGRPSAPGSLFHPLRQHLGSGDARARARWDVFLGRLTGPRRPARGEAGEGERRLRRAAELASLVKDIREPLVLAVDALEHWDEVSIALLLDLVRQFGASPPGARPPLGLLVAYREEGASAPLLSELTGFLLRGGRAWTITLGALGVEDTLALYRKTADREAGKQSGLSVFHETGGCPGRILALAARPPGRASPPEGDRAGVPLRAISDPRKTELLLLLELLGRPAPVAELARLLRRSGKAVRGLLAQLHEERLARPLETDSPNGGWLPESASRAFTAGVTPDERRGLHDRIARDLCRRGFSRSDRESIEAVRHFQAAGRGSQVIRHGLRAARSLKLRFQNRAALELFRTVLGTLPPARWEARLEVAMEAADLHARTGDLEEGISLLREILSRAPDLSGPSRARAFLRQATLHCRKGDSRTAEGLFRKGFRLAGSPPRLSREELLYFINERAALQVAMGRRRAAAKLCARGFRLAGRSRNPVVRAVVLDLHATRANLALRDFRFDAAARDLETALQIAQAIGSPGSQATILNNLGVVWLQCERYGDAIRAFREAEKVCLQLDEGPSLASIYGNLAVLHAKTGDFAALESALGKGEKLVPSSVGRRQELFLLHARGLAALYRGRYTEARTGLEAAIRLGEEIGDHRVTAFDELYRAEALIYQGRYGEADRELARLASPESSANLRRMALARRAFLAALTARPGASRSAAAERSSITAEVPVPFLEVWDLFYLGWAASIRGETEEALRKLERAGGFFERHGLRPAASLATWARAEAHLLGGDPEQAASLVLEKDGGLRPGLASGDLASVLYPLLAARLLLERTPPDHRRAADLLARAGSGLIGNPLPEWEARLGALRTLLSGELPPSGPPRSRAELALELPAGERRRYFASRHFRVWSRLPGPAPTGGKAGPRAGEARPPDTRTLPLPGPGSPPARAALVAASLRMRRLLRVLDRLKVSMLPVLITGETGSGKELVARVIHRESPRGGMPFQVLDCAAIPGPLLEVELFGARAGAFTDLTEDRPGLLRLAEGGTLLIDEIAGAPPELQAKLLRVLSERTIRPLGAEEEIPIDVRFLFSTARDLEAGAREGRFREDLLHRIRVVTIEVPPLRERPEDLPGLVEVFLAEPGGQPQAVGRRALERLRHHSWPGNVRQLQNVLAGLRIQHPGGISVEAIDLALADPKTDRLFPRNLLELESLPALRERLEREYLTHHFQRLGGDSRALASFLGLGLRQFYRRCERLGIRLRKEKE